MPVRSLSTTPLTAREALSVTEELGLDDIDYQEDMQSLRGLGVLRMLRYIRGWRRDPLVLVSRNDADIGFVSAMVVIALLSSASDVSQLDLAKQKRRQLSSLMQIYYAASMLVLSVLYVLALPLFCVGLWFLLWVQRQSPPDKKPEALIYLKTNLLPGTQAGGSIGHVAGVLNGLGEYFTRRTLLSVDRGPLIDNDVAFHKVPALTNMAYPMELNNFRFNKAVLAAGKAVLKQQKTPHLIYQRLSLGNFAGALLSRWSKSYFVLEYNGSEAWIATHWGGGLRFSRLAFWAERASLRHAHKIVTVSDVLKQQLLDKGVEDDRIIVYPNCIDPETFDPSKRTPDRDVVRQRLGIEQDATVVSFIGTFGAWHGVPEMTQAIKSICAQEDVAKHVKFLMVGEGVALRGLRSALVDEINQGRVILTGLVPQDEAPLYLAASDICLSPQNVPGNTSDRFIGSPTKIFEYMAMGKAIVASDLDQMGEVLRPAYVVRGGQVEAENTRQADDACAILFTPGDFDGLRLAILRFLQDKKLRAIMGRNARAVALARFCWSHHVDAIMNGIVVRDNEA